MQPIVRLVFLTFLLAHPAWADTIWLTNGDRLSGQVMLIDSGKLLLKTDFAGTISIDADKITTLETHQSLHIREQAFAKPFNSRILAAEGNTIALPQQNGKTLAVTDIYRALPITESSLIEDLQWSGSVHLSADYKRKESSSDSYDLDIKNKVRHGLWRHNADAQYSYETKDNQKKTDNLMLGYALDRFFSERWFWQNKFKYSHNRMEELRKQYTLGTGPGFQFWDDEISALSVTGLLNHSIFKYKDGDYERYKRFNSSTVSWDYQRFFRAKTLEFFNKGEVSLPFTSDVEYVLDAETGLRYKLNSWASFALKAEWEKVRSKYGNLNDRRYLLGIGVAW